jgi:cardiolipin synthase
MEAHETPVRCFIIRMKKHALRTLPLVLLLSAGCSTFAPEKRIRQSIRADYSVTDPQFANSISHLLNAPLVPGNDVVELLNGDQAFEAMLDAIHRAQKTVTLEQYIWSSGKVTTRFVNALSERARAGVKVHIIIDAAGSLAFKRSDVQALRDAGAQLVRYNLPHVLRIFGTNHRTHRKLLVVDGRIGFIGGICISDAWAGNAEPPQWRDTHFRVEGPVVGQIQGVFTVNWLQARSDVLHGEDYFPPPAHAGSMLAQCFQTGPHESPETARLAYLFSMAAARKHIRLAHAYFVPNALATKTLVEARRRGVRIEIIVPAKSDNAVVAKAARSRWGKLLEAGVEIYEYQPTLYHCKIMIVDDAWVSVGSVNFDERSFRYNDEANLNVLNQELAAELIESFEADKALSRRLTIDNFDRRNFVSKSIDQFVGLFRWGL